MIITEQQINSLLDFLQTELLDDKNKNQVILSYRWANQFPSKPGVYVAFEEGGLVYAGETGNIRGRMKDLLDSRHHTLRRNIGKRNFSNITGYINANSKMKFPDYIEDLVNSWFESKIKISVLPVRIGRKELEERIVAAYNPTYNKKGERISN